MHCRVMFLMDMEAVESRPQADEKARDDHVDPRVLPFHLGTRTKNAMYY